MRDQSVDGAEAHPIYQNSFAKLVSSAHVDGDLIAGSSIESAYVPVPESSKRENKSLIEYTLLQVQVP